MQPDKPTFVCRLEMHRQDSNRKSKDVLGILWFATFCLTVVIVIIQLIRWW